MDPAWITQTTSDLELWLQLSTGTVSYGRLQVDGELGLDGWTEPSSVT